MSHIVSSRVSATTVQLVWDPDPEQGPSAAVYHLALRSAEDLVLDVDTDEFMFEPEVRKVIVQSTTMIHVQQLQPLVY